MNEKDVEGLEKKLGYAFKDKKILITALSHKSFVNECRIKPMESYERLEFLGDSILEYIVSEFLYKNYQDLTEGELTKLRASLVCEFTLSKIARDIGYGNYIRLSKGEKSTGGSNRDSILCDVFESVLGAIYIDGGMESSKQYVFKFLLDDIKHKQLYYDCKTKLQELTQKDGNSTLRYELVSADGPEHDKLYKVRVMIDEKEISQGTGHNKKSAEQEAAFNALKLLM